MYTVFWFNKQNELKKSTFRINAYHFWEKLGKNSLFGKNFKGNWHETS